MAAENTNEIATTGDEKYIIIRAYTRKVSVGEYSWLLIQSSVLASHGHGRANKLGGI